jgi:hypothetical protein
MASTYSDELKLELMATGEKAGLWGSITNTNLGTLLEEAIGGYTTQAITDGADTTITIPNAATGIARHMCIEMTGTLTAARNMIVPDAEKLYVIYNNTAGGYAVTVKVSGQTGISVPAGYKMLLHCNGTDIVSVVDYFASINNVVITAPASQSTLTLGSGKTVSISNSITLTGTDGSTTNTDAVSAAAVTIKLPCTVATTANITLSGGQTIDGVAVTTGDRVLVKDQTDATENGIYVVAAGAWARATDFAASTDIVQGTFVVVNNGDTNGGTWKVTTADPITLDTDDIDFAATGGVGATYVNITLSGTKEISGSTSVTGDTNYNNNITQDLALQGFSEVINAIGTVGNGETCDISFDYNYHTCTFTAGSSDVTFSDIKPGTLLSECVVGFSDAGLSTLTWNDATGIYFMENDGTGDWTLDTATPSSWDFHSAALDIVCFFAVSTGAVYAKLVR